LPRPYSVGYVDLDEDMIGAGLRIFCLFDPGSMDQLRIGAKVILQAAPLGHDVRGEVCLRPFFKPIDGE
jgi:uncharacterized OB-fold protein